MASYQNIHLVRRKIDLSLEVMIPETLPYTSMHNLSSLIRIKLCKFLSSSIFELVQINGNLNIFHTKVFMEKCKLSIYVNTIFPSKNRGCLYSRGCPNSNRYSTWNVNTPCQPVHVRKTIFLG